MSTGINSADMFEMIQSCVNANIIDSYQGIELRWKLSELINKKIVEALSAN